MLLHVLCWVKVILADLDFLWLWNFIFLFIFAAEGKLNLDRLSEETQLRLAAQTAADEAKSEMMILQVEMENISLTWLLN